MGELRLYKKFYTIGIIRTGSTVEQNYVLLNPYSLSANTYTAGTGATESNSIIESSVVITQESEGVYYAYLNSNLYSSDITYDLVWFTNYTSLAPIKKLSTRFRINVNSISNQIEVEYLNYPLGVELSLNNSIEIDIL